MSNPNPVLMVAGMALVTQIPRILPFLILGSKPLPQGLRQWLSYVPASIICAMLATELLVNQGRVTYVGKEIFLLAAVPTLFMAVTARNILVSVLTGLVSVALLRVVF